MYMGRESWPVGSDPADKQFLENEAAQRQITCSAPTGHNATSVWCRTHIATFMACFNMFNMFTKKTQQFSV